MGNQGNQTEEFSALWRDVIQSGRWYRSATTLLAVVALVVLGVVLVQSLRPVPAPLVIRVDAAGAAEVVDYQFERSLLDQNDPVVGYFLHSFVRDHFERRHALRAERWQRSLAFLTPELEQRVYDANLEELTAFVSAPLASEFIVENVVVRVAPDSGPPYAAEVVFDRVERYRAGSLVGATEMARERLTLSLRFVFADVPGAMLLVNPLGLVITYLDVQGQFVGVDGLG